MYANLFLVKHHYFFLLLVLSIPDHPFIVGVSICIDCAQNVRSKDRSVPKSYLSVYKLCINLKRFIYSFIVFFICFIARVVEKKASNRGQNIVKKALFRNRTKIRCSDDFRISCVASALNTFHLSRVPILIESHQ